jgi:hypothetical protein
VLWNNVVHQCEGENLENEIKKVIKHFLNTIENYNKGQEKYLDRL